MGWMPKPVSWIRTILLVCVAVVTGFLLTGLNNSPKTIYFASQTPSLFLMILAFVIFIPCVVYAYIHCWILGNKPDGWAKKIPSPSSIKEASLTYVVTYFGLLITLLITSPFAPDFSRYGAYRYREDLERFYYVLSFSWFVVSLYMFHAYDLISNPQTKKTISKSKSEAVNSKVNSVDRDLLKLKHQTGLMINQPKKADKDK